MASFNLMPGGGSFQWMPGLPGVGGAPAPAMGGASMWPQALMGLGAGMAQAGAPSPTPGGWGRAIGLGLLGAQNMMQQEKGNRILQAQNQRAQAAETRAQTQFDQQQQQLQRQQQLWQNMSGMQGPAGQVGSLGVAYPNVAAPLLGQAIRQQMEPQMPLSPQGKQAWDVQQGFLPDQPATQPVFAGTGMPAQQANKLFELGPLVQAGTATPEQQQEYAFAYAQVGKPTMFRDQQTGEIVEQRPDMSMFPAPSGGVAQTMPVGPTLPPPAQMMGATPRPAGNGTTPQAPQPMTRQTQGGSGTTYPGTRMRESVQKEFRAASNVLSELRQSYEAYRNSLVTEGSALLPTQARDLQLKMKEAYNLGVLNGPDLMLMEQVINQPGTIGREFREWFGGEAGGLLPQLDASVESLLEGKERMIEETYGRPPIGRGGVTINNRQFSEDDIQDTMRIRGMSRAEVIQALEDRYGGSAR